MLFTKEETRFLIVNAISIAQIVMEFAPAMLANECEPECPSELWMKLGAWLDAHPEFRSENSMALRKALRVDFSKE